MDRVIVTRPMQGICHMQVCAARNATDEEILAVCNRDNPSGTEKGWTHVLRHDEEFLGTSGGGPVPCADDPENRFHFLVAC